MKNVYLKVWTILLLSFVGLANVNAQFLEDTETVDIVLIPGFDSDGGLAQYYVADLGNIVEWTTQLNDYAKWYKIPAGAVNDGTSDVQAYYYKNVATGKYLYVSETSQTELTSERSGDWPIVEAETLATNDKTLDFKWFNRVCPWGWGIYLTNAASIDITQAEGNQFNVLTSIILMKVNEGGINGDEFFGVYEPKVSIGGFKGGTGNAWTAIKTPIVAEAGVLNPDVPHFLKNTKTVDVIQITTWMAPNNSKLGGATPYVATTEAGEVVYTTAASDNTKWYEIPAGGNEFGQQVYYYKNVATGAYLKGSDRVPGEGGDWTVSPATISLTNDRNNLFKWSKVNSNWGEGYWLVNEQGNTGTLPSGENKNAFFALTMLTANSEFFGVDVPNVAISNPHDGGNAWTAVKINVAQAGIINPDYVSDGKFIYSTDSLNFFANDDGEDSNASSYNTETKTITYKNGGWHRAGWNWETEGGVDVSDYNQVWIKFDASALPKTGDGENGATKIQFDVVYMDDSTGQDFDNKTNELRSNNTEYFYNITPGKKIKRITLKSEVEGDIVLTDAYFYKKGVDPVDLIITDITWSPANPVLGDSILFSATIKNISEFTSQDVKHGVVFGVKLPSASGNGTLVAWSDTHLTSLAPGASVTVTANGGPNDGNGKWKPGAARTFTVVAQVNDQHDVLESDYNNNILEKEIIVNQSAGLENVIADGYVFVSDGKLHLINFPENATVNIYNMQAQKIGNYRVSEVSELTLSKNLYVVKIQDGDKSSTFKVLIK